MIFLLEDIFGWPLYLGKVVTIQAYRVHSILKVARSDYQ